MYETILSRIRNESIENFERARLVLQCLVVSVRPMTLEELVEVLALRRGQVTISNHDRLWDPRDVLDICQGLLKREKEGTVSLAHFSVKEFLVLEKSQPSPISNFNICPTVAHGLVAEICLSYLLILGKQDLTLAFKIVSDTEENRSPVLDEGDIKTQYQEIGVSESFKVSTNSTRPMFSDLPLANYAACFWPWHYRHASANEHNACDDLICKLLDRSLNFNFTNWLHASRADVQEVSSFTDLEKFGLNKFSGPLFYAASLGLSTNVISYVVENGQNPRHCWQTSGETPLKTIHDQDLRTRSPVHAAATRGHKEVVEWLLRHIGDVNLLDHRGETPLHAAISGRQRDIVHYLVQTGADVNYGVYHYYISPLQQAVQWGDSTVIHLLLNHGAKLTHPHPHWFASFAGVQPLVYTAAANNHVSIVKTLLERGADPNEQLGTAKSALAVACQNGNQALFNLLLLHGADVNREDENAGTPLAAACAAGDEAMANILLNHSGLDSNYCTGLTATALDSAAQSGKYSLVQRLLQTHPSHYRSGQRLNRALFWAAGRGHHQVVELILAAGADVNAVMDFNSMDFCSMDFGCMCDTALQFAAAKGHVLVVQALIDHGADVSYRSSATNTALDYARRARLDAQDEQAQISLDEVITLLQRQGAIDSSPSDVRPNQDIADRRDVPSMFLHMWGNHIFPNIPAQPRDVLIKAWSRGFFNENGDFDQDVEDKDLVRACFSSILEEIGFTGRIKAAFLEFADRINHDREWDAVVEDLVAQTFDRLAPGEDVSEMFSNGLHAMQAIQRRQEMDPDAILGLLAPSMRVLGAFLGLENSDPIDVISTIAQRIRTMGLIPMDGTMMIDLSRFMPVAEPFGVSRKGVEFLASIGLVEVVDDWTYREDTCARHDLVLESSGTSKLTRIWSMIHRQILTTLLVLWLDHRNMLRLWFVGLVMSGTALFVKSLILPLLRSGSLGYE